MWQSKESKDTHQVRIPIQIETKSDIIISRKPICQLLIIERHFVIALVRTKRQTKFINERETNHPKYVCPLESESFKTAGL